MFKFIKPAAVTLGLLVSAGQVSAHVLPGGSVMDFESGTITPSNVIGPLPGSLFAAFGQSYVEDGVVHGAIGFGTTAGNSIGVVTGGGSHVHGEPGGLSPTGGIGTVSAYLRDSGGGFFQLADKAAFAITGLDVHSMNFNNADGTDTTMTLRGYTSADFSTFTDVKFGGGADGLTATSVNGDFLTEAGNAVNGFNGTHLHLDGVAAFQDIFLFEYFYDSLGRGNDGSLDPNLISLVTRIDNVEFAQVSAVPVPAAVYLFGTAMMGLIGMGKKRRDSSVIAA